MGAGEEKASYVSGSVILELLTFCAAFHQGAYLENAKSLLAIALFVIRVVLYLDHV